MSLRRPIVPLACALVLALAGCGFHPRGAAGLPASLGPVKVFSVDPYSALVDDLRRSIARAGSASPGVADAAGVTLVIAGEGWDQQPLSVNAHAQATEYYLTYVVKYELLDASHKAIVPMQQVRLQRDYQYDAAHALGSAQEQDTIHEEMRRDMAAMILRQLGVALRNDHH